MHHVQFAVQWRSTPLFFLRCHIFGHLSSMLCRSFGKCICHIHFLIPAKLKGSHVLLKPCSISCPQSFMSAQLFGHILFQMAPPLIEQLCSSELSFAFHLTISLTCIFTWTTLRNGRRNFPHSDRQNLAPTLCPP